MHETWLKRGSQCTRSCSFQRITSVALFWMSAQMRRIVLDMQLTVGEFYKGAARIDNEGSVGIP